MSLTAKQQAFVREYLLDLNATQAAIRAGYSAKSAEVNGSRLLRNARVRKAVDTAIARRSVRVQVRQDDVLRDLVEVVERSMQRAPVMVFGGREVGMVQKIDDEGRHVWEFNANAANKALELLGKHLKMFTDVREHTHNFSELTDEQLEAKLNNLVEKREAEKQEPAP